MIKKKKSMESETDGWLYILIEVELLVIQISQQISHTHMMTNRQIQMDHNIANDW